MATRIGTMLDQFGPTSGSVVFCGGGARSPALKRALEKIIGFDLLLPEHPQHIVAYGAALVAAGKE